VEITLDALRSRRRVAIELEFDAKDQWVGEDVAAPCDDEFTDRRGVSVFVRGVRDCVSKFHTTHMAAMDAKIFPDPGYVMLKKMS